MTVHGVAESGGEVTLRSSGDEHKVFTRFTRSAMRGLITTWAVHFDT